MKPILTVADFQAAVARKAAILITDTANGNKAHQMPCVHVRQEYFEMKVIKNRGKNGAYFELPSATPPPPGATRCPMC